MDPTLEAPDRYDDLDPSWREARRAAGINPNAAVQRPEPAPSIVQGAIPGLLGVQMGQQRWPDSPGLWGQFAGGGVPIGGDGGPGVKMGDVDTQAAAGGVPIGSGPLPAQAEPNVGQSVGGVLRGGGYGQVGKDVADTIDMWTSPSSAAAAVPEPGGGISAKAAPATGTPAASAPPDRFASAAPGPIFGSGTAPASSDVVPQPGGPTAAPPGSPPATRHPSPTNPRSPQTGQPIIPPTSALGRVDAAQNAQAGFPGLLSKLFQGGPPNPFAEGGWIKSHPLTLLAMAGGMGGKQSIGTGLSSAFSAAVPAAQADLAYFGPYGKVAAITANAGLLQKLGASPEEIHAATLDPQGAGKLIMEKYTGPTAVNRQLIGRGGTQGTGPTTAQMNAQPEEAQVQLLRTMPGHRLQLNNGDIIANNNGQLVYASGPNAGQPYQTAAR